MARPGSERATNAWPRAASATGEPLGIDFGALSDMALYRASDHPLTHRTALEDHMFGTVGTLFSPRPVVTLYDLTNTYSGGEASGQPKARRGHSRERRSDAPPLTLGAVPAGGGFPRRAGIFPGNVAGARTLATMLASLEVPGGGTVVMDRGIATGENLAWMRARGYVYPVVSRSSTRVFDPDVETATVTTASNGAVSACLDPVDGREEDGTPYGEVFPRCHSTARETKETGLITHFRKRFGEGLRALHDGLSKPRTRKTLTHVQRGIGRLRKENAVVARHYAVTVTPDPANGRAVAIAWELDPSEGSMLRKPGVYSLRSNCLDWDAEAMWKTHATLTDVESVFRSPRSELGLRPIHHHRERRADGHLFISVIAYRAIQVLRTRMAQRGMTASWTTVRNVLRSLPRVTTTFARPDGRRVRVRNTALPNADRAAVYQAMRIAPPAPNPRRTVV